MVDQPEFKNALQFYVDLVKDAGEKDAAGSSFNECLSQYKDGKVAMWYDATVAAGLLEADDSPVKGKNGFAPAPVDQTPASGWLWSLGACDPGDLRASGPRLEVHLVRDRSAVPQGGRDEGPGRMGRDPARHAQVDLPDPGVQEGSRRVRAAHARRDLRRRRSTIRARPSGRGFPGVQYVGIPEFQDVGNQCTQQFSAVIAGRTPIDTALENCQGSGIRSRG